jgi:hypothetical protein
MGIDYIRKSGKPHPDPLRRRGRNNSSDSYTPLLWRRAGGEVPNVVNILLFVFKHLLFPYQINSVQNHYELP